MSGGSLDYLYSRVDDCADSIEAMCNKPIYRAFARHLRLVSKALHDIEWVHSGDYGDGDKEKAIMRVINKYDVVDNARENAEKALKDLREALKEAK